MLKRKAVRLWMTSVWNLSRVFIQLGNIKFVKHVSNKTIVKALKLGQALGSIYAPLAQVKIKICILRGQLRVKTYWLMRLMIMVPSNSRLSKNKKRLKLSVYWKISLQLSRALISWERTQLNSNSFSTVFNRLSVHQSI